MKCKVTFVCTVGEDVCEGVETFKGQIEFKENKVWLRYSVTRSDFSVFEGVEQEPGHYLLKLSESTFLMRADVSLHRFNGAHILVGLYDGMYQGGRGVKGFIKVDMEE